MTNLQNALNYIKNGIKIFPCTMDKKPITKNGFKDATTDVATVTKWFSKKNRLIGAPNDQFTVLDIDRPHSATGKLVLDTVIADLKSSGFINKSSVEVTTMSGGTHYYFKTVEGVTRKIRNLPFIDLLGEGGYVILPDQNTYTMKGVSHPWLKMNNLPEMDLPLLNVFIEKYEEMTRESILLGKGDVVKVVNGKTTKESPRYTISEDGKVVYKQDSASVMYERTEDEDFTRFDPTVKLLDGDGKVRINVGDITDSSTLMRLFHNQDIQTRLAKWMGLTVPSLNEEKNVQRSVIERHNDAKPSMGLRWRLDKSILIARDFANFHGDRHNNLDFNLVRLYATNKIGGLAPRLKPREFNMFFLDMLYESGILDIDEIEYFKPLDALVGVNLKVAKAIQKLVAFNRLFAANDGFVVFTKAFGSSFAGVSATSVSNAKDHLMKNGYLFDCGYLNTRESDNAYYDTTAVAIINTEHGVEYEIDEDKYETQVARKAEQIAIKRKEYFESKETYSNQKVTLKVTSKSIVDIIAERKLTRNKPDSNLDSNQKVTLDEPESNQYEPYRPEINFKVTSKTIIDLIKERKLTLKKPDINLDSNHKVTLKKPESNQKVTLDEQIQNLKETDSDLYETFFKNSDFVRVQRE